MTPADPLLARLRQGGRGRLCRAGRAAPRPAQAARALGAARRSGGRRSRAGRVDRGDRRARFLRGPIFPEHLALSNRAQPRPHPPPARRAIGPARSSTPCERRRQRRSRDRSGQLSSRRPLEKQPVRLARAASRASWFAKIRKRPCCAESWARRSPPPSRNCRRSWRTVVTMRDVDGLTSEEVCNALEISESNQRVLLHRGRSRLRMLVEAEHGKERQR